MGGDEHRYGVKLDIDVGMRRGSESLPREIDRYPHYCKEVEYGPSQHGTTSVSVHRWPPSVYTRI